MVACLERPGLNSPSTHFNHRQNDPAHESGQWLVRLESVVARRRLPVVRRKPLTAESVARQSPRFVYGDCWRSSCAIH